MQIIIEHTTNPIVIICSDFDGVSVLATLSLETNDRIDT